VDKKGLEFPRLAFILTKLTSFFTLLSTQRFFTVEKRNIFLGFIKSSFIEVANSIIAHINRTAQDKARGEGKNLTAFYFILDVVCLPVCPFIHSSLIDLAPPCFRQMDEKTARKGFSFLIRTNS